MAKTREQLMEEYGKKFADDMLVQHEEAGQKMKDLLNLIWDLAIQQSDWHPRNTVPIGEMVDLWIKNSPEHIGERYVNCRYHTVHKRWIAGERFLGPGQIIHAWRRIPSGPDF